MTNLPSTPRSLLRIAPGLPAPRVAVITGSYGAGHNSAAREIARTVTDAGCEVDTHDVVALLPWRLGPLLRAVYYWQLRHQPASWDTTLRLLEPDRLLHGVVTALLAAAAKPVVEATRGCDLVITTHPFGAQAIGHARSTGQLSIPAITYLTDASVHALWVHPGVDLNLAIHEIAAHEAAAYGGETMVVRPVVPPRVIRTPSAEIEDPLATYQITGGRALVTGGSLGMGDLEWTARDIARTGIMTPIVLCGTDDRLRRRLDSLPGVVALGWRDDMPALLETSDCVVQNAGGFTSLEALASGIPIVTYRPLPGHGAANSINLERAGLIPWARTPEDLAVLLTAASTALRIDRLPAGAPDVLAALTGSEARLAAA